MREIKFRAWSDDDNQMIYGLDSIVGEYDGYKYNLNDLGELPIMQFTGLRDHKGREIYEGDIVKACIYNDETPQILTVKYEDCAFIIDYQDSESDVCNIGWFVGNVEVIGNIYENPKLLEYTCQKPAKR